MPGGSELGRWSWPVAEAEQLALADPQTRAYADDLVSSENPRIGAVDPTHVGPPDLILQEIVAPSEVPEDIRRRFETSAGTGANRPVTIVPIADGGVRVPAPVGAADRTDWDDVTFAGRALALVEGTDRPDYDDYDDALVWVLALSADSPVVGEAIVSGGEFATSSVQYRYSKGEPTRRGKRVSFFGAIRTEPRNA